MSEVNKFIAELNYEETTNVNALLKLATLVKYAQLLDKKKENVVISRDEARFLSQFVSNAYEFLELIKESQTSTPES